MRLTRGPRRQALWFIGLWLAGVIGMGLVSGLLELGMKQLR
jgi:cell division septal protein FtsQ